VAIGNNATITASNQIMLGTSSHDTQIPGTLTVNNSQQYFKSYYVKYGKTAPGTITIDIGSIYVTSGMIDAFLTLPGSANNFTNVRFMFNGNRSSNNQFISTIFNYLSSSQSTLTITASISSLNIITLTFGNTSVDDYHFGNALLYGSKG